MSRGPNYIWRFFECIKDYFYLPRQFERNNISKIMPFYAVRKGHNPGIYDNWGDCQKSVNGYSSAAFKKFNTEAEARSFIDGNLQMATGSTSKVLNKPMEHGYSTRSAKTKSASVYVDGCCFRNGMKGAKAGYGIYWGPQDSRNVSAPLYMDNLDPSDSTSNDHFTQLQSHTNNKAEIKAAHEAILQAHKEGITQLTLYTDSNLLINSLKDWMPKWKQNGWKTATGDPVKNQNELRALDQDLTNLGVNVKWVHVPGHAGIEGNEAADQLAKSGALKS